MKIWTAQELSDHYFAETYLIDPIVPRGGVVLFHGKRGIGKTQFIMTLISCLAEGGRLFGRYRTKSNIVAFYVQADMTESLQQDRVKRARKLYDLSKTYYSFPILLNLPELTHEDPWVRSITTLHPDLIIWDTLREVHRLDSNEDSSPSLVYGAARGLFPSATHIFVHHDKKTIADQNMLDDDEFFRGSGAWLDKADTGLHLAAIAPGHLLLTFTKTRTCAPQNPLSLTMHPETLLLYASEDASKLMHDWRLAHPQGTESQLRRYLMASFVASPRSIDHLLRGDEKWPTQQTSSLPLRLV